METLFALPKGRVPPHFEGRLIARRLLTSGTRYVPSPGTRSIFVEMVGGGAAGGGGVATAASTASVGSGGGAGAYCNRFFDRIDGPCEISIGQGGAGVAGGQGNGGGSTTFRRGRILVTAPGPGTGGNTIAAGSTVLVALGGVGTPVSTGGDVSMQGAYGHHGFRTSGTLGASGHGASSPFGTGGGHRSNVGGGLGATGYGSGGGGSFNQNNGATNAGGAGAQGCIVVWEFA